MTIQQKNISILKFDLPQILLIISFLFCSSIFPAQADILKLIDGTRMIGTLTHYYGGVFEFETKENTVTVPKEKVQSISFVAREARKEFSTPEDTFKTWIKAIRENKTETMVECYGLLYQSVIVRQMEDLSAEERHQVFSDFLKNDLKIVGREEKDGSINLKLEFSEDNKTETVWLKFVDESNEWKMYP